MTTASPERADAHWWQADPRRVERERGLLPPPWTLGKDGNCLAWSGGQLSAARGQIIAPPRSAKLIYPLGFPARFIEVRLLPEPPRDLWGVLGTHLNVDGSICFIAGESWSPQMTVKEALALSNDWWFNYWVIVEKGLSWLRWPRSGRVKVPRDDLDAVLHRR